MLVEPKAVCSEVLVAKQMAVDIACWGDLLSRSAATAALDCLFMDLMSCRYVSYYSLLSN